MRRSTEVVVLPPHLDGEEAAVEDVRTRLESTITAFRDGSFALFVFNLELLRVQQDHADPPSIVRLLESDDLKLNCLHVRDVSYPSLFLCDLNHHPCEQHLAIRDPLDGIVTFCEVGFEQREICEAEQNLSGASLGIQDETSLFEQERGVAEKVEVLLNIWRNVPLLLFGSYNGNEDGGAAVLTGEGNLGGRDTVKDIAFVGLQVQREW